MEWKALQNGSDIRGVAMGGVPGEEVNLGSSEAYILGGSFAVWLRTRKPGSSCIAVGMDSRISGPELKSAFIRGVTDQGMDVIDCGMASTPAMFMTTLDEELNADAGVMLTASHLPYNRNGMKFFTSDGGLDKKDITGILETAASFDRKAASLQGTVRTTDFISIYSDFLADTICTGVNDQRDFRKKLNHEPAVFPENEHRQNRSTRFQGQQRHPLVGKRPITEKVSNDPFIPVHILVHQHCHQFLPFQAI